MPVNEPGNIRPRINKIVNTKYGSVAVPQTTIPENKYQNIRNYTYYRNSNYTYINHKWTTQFSKNKLKTEIIKLNY